MQAQSGTATASLRRSAARQFDNNMPVQRPVVAIIVDPGSGANSGNIG
jgi:hypothetical protein